MLTRLAASRADCVLQTGLGLTLILLASAGLAQSDAEILEQLSECSAVTPDRARLNCFDGVFAGLAQARRAAETGSPGAAAAPSAFETETGTTAVAAREAEPVARRARRNSTIPERDSRVVTVVRMLTLARGNLRFVTEDGEVFTQPVGEARGRYPTLPFEAELDAGSMGSFFIEPIEMGPRTRVSLAD